MRFLRPSVLFVTISAVTGCLAVAAPPEQEPMGLLPTAVTTAEPEWLPAWPRAGRVVASEPRETALAEPRRVTEGLEVETVAWSPDGTRLAYVARKPGDERRSVTVVTLATGARSVASLPQEDATSARFVDAERVAFVARTQGSAFLVVARADGAERATVALDAGAEPVGLGASPGGTSWLLVQRADGPAIASVGASGAMRTVATGAGRHVAPVAAHARDRAAWVSAAGDVHVASSEGRGARTIPAATVGRVTHLALSEDGRALFFASDRDTAQGALYRVGLDGDAWPPAPERLTFAQGGAPAPSPDGKHLAFSSRRGGPTADMYLARLGEAP